MKLLLLVCLVVTVSWTDGFMSKIQQILSMTYNLNKYVSECIEEFKEDDVTGLRTSESDEGSRLQNVTQCFFMKTGILTPEGKINAESAHAILSLLGIDKYVTQEMLEKCTSIVGFDAEDTTFAIFKCFEDGFRNLDVL